MYEDNFSIGGVSVHPPILAEWNIRQIDKETQEVLYEETKRNLIVDTGRVNLLQQLFGLSPGAALISLGFGACSTAAAHGDTRLNYEYTRTAQTPATNRYGLTNTSGAGLTSPDIVAETYVDSTESPSITYYEKIVVQSIIPTTDPNTGQPVQEYGLFTNAACPSTPTSLSGVMFNHLVAASPITINSSTQIVVQITLRV